MTAEIFLEGAKPPTFFGAPYKTDHFYRVPMASAKGANKKLTFELLFSVASYDVIFFQFFKIPWGGGGKCSPCTLAVGAPWAQIVLVLVIEV